MTKTKKLTKKELEYYKNVLLAIREKVGEEVGQIEKDYLRKSSKDSSGDISSQPFHMADVASDSFDTEFNIGLASNEKNILYEIDAALRRIKEGTFGICEKYGTPIGKKRLKAVPYARYSIKAQEEEEKER